MERVVVILLLHYLVKQDVEHAKMIIMDELSFKFVENEGFKLFCNTACPKFDPPSRVTIARDIFQLYLEKKKS